MSKVSPIACRFFVVFSLFLATLALGKNEHVLCDRVLEEFVAESQRGSLGLNEDPYRDLVTR